MEEEEEEEEEEESLIKETKTSGRAWANGREDAAKRKSQATRLETRGKRRRRRAPRDAAYLGNGTCI